MMAYDTSERFGLDVDTREQVPDLRNLAGLPICIATTALPEFSMRAFGNGDKALQVRQRSRTSLHG